MLFELILPVILMSALIAITHACLGIEVLKRGIIFIDLAIAQIAGLGFIIAGSINLSLWQGQFLALTFALVAGYLFYQFERKVPDKQEALIGTAFVLTSSLALLLLSQQPHGHDDLTTLLSGQILFITWSDIFWHAPIYTLILLYWWLKPHYRKNLMFYLLFATAVTSSVQLIGVYLVFTSLVVPALIANQNSRTAIIFGLTAMLSGILIAVFFDMITGPVVVLVYAILAFSLKGNISR